MPVDIPAALAVGQMARVLNLKEETVKRALPSFRLVDGKSWCLVRSTDVAELVQGCGLLLNWEAVV